MGLMGFRDYFEQNRAKSVFDDWTASGVPMVCHIHGQRILIATLLSHSAYEVKLAVDGGGEENLHKTQIKLVYPVDLFDRVRPLIKSDKKIAAMQLDPIYNFKGRHFIKNKTLFPLMKEREVVFFTLLEGEVLRGLVGGFSTYEITLNLKGGVPVTILRHAVHDLRNKKGRCFLKSVQNVERDWQKSPLFKSGPV